MFSCFRVNFVLICFSRTFIKVQNMYFWLWCRFWMSGSLFCTIYIHNLLRFRVSAVHLSWTGDVWNRFWKLLSFSICRLLTLWSTENIFGRKEIVLENSQHLFATEEVIEFIFGAQLFFLPRVRKRSKRRR